MKLLLDNYLSVKTVDRLQQEFPGTSHFFLLNIHGLSDREIWTYAAEHAYTILTRDKDFYHHAHTLGSPPKVIWITLGNFRNNELPGILHNKVNEIRSFISGGKSILIIS